MTTLDSDLKNILESLGKRLYDIEQVVTSGEVMGQTNTFDDEIVIVDDLGNPLPISVLGPDDVTDIAVDTDAHFDNIFADVSWSEALTGYDAGSYVVRLYINEGLGIRTFVSQDTTAATNYRFNNLIPNTDYSVTVTPYSRIGVPGDPSGFIDFTTGQDSTIPPQVQDVVVGRGATSVVVSFTPLDELDAPDVAAGNGIYEVEISTKNTFAETSYLALSGSELSEPAIVATASVTALNQTGDVEHEFLNVVTRRWDLPYQGLASKGAYGEWAFAAGFIEHKPSFYMTDDGATLYPATATADLPYGIGEPFDLKITRQRTGPTKFWHRPAGVGAYVQLGADVTAGLNRFIYVANGHALRVGAYLSNDFAFGGSIGKYVFRNGIGGAEVANPDFSAQTSGTVGFTDTAGRFWSVSSQASIQDGYRNTYTNDQVIAFNDVAGDSGWYARVRAIDGSGNIGPWSDVAGPALAGGVTDKMIVADLSAAKIKTGYLNASRIETQSLVADKIKTSELTASMITLVGGGSLFAGDFAGGEGVWLNPTGLYLYQGGSPVVTLDALTGNASFKGTVTASTIIGSSISGGTITGAVFQTSDDRTQIDNNGLRIFASGAGAPGLSEIVRWVNPANTADTIAWIEAHTTAGVEIHSDFDVGLNGDFIGLSPSAGTGSWTVGPTITTGTNVTLVGALTVFGAKSFMTSHPLRPDAALIHACLEGPENGVFYRGRGSLKNGKAVVELPDYFALLTGHKDVTVLVTPIADSKGKWSDVAPTDVKDGKFTVFCKGGGEDCSFSWVVFSIRDDIPRLVTELEADTIEEIHQYERDLVQHGKKIRQEAKDSLRASAM